jgi:hypothetical protein
MAATNGSDDELFVDAADTEPAPFTFQSDLSDEDAPDPRTLDKIAKETLAALNGTSISPAKDERRSWLSNNDGHANGTVEPAAHKPREDIVSVRIEVQLPWLSPARRAEYRKIRVEDYRPEEPGQARTRKRRRRVSNCYCVAQLPVVMWVTRSWMTARCVGEKVEGSPSRSRCSVK